MNEEYDDELIEKLKQIAIAHIEEVEHGDLVYMTCTCKKCGQEWRTALNSKIPGVQASMDEICSKCRREQV